MAKRRALRIALLGLLVFGIALLSAGAWVLYSPSGLQWLTTRSTVLMGERLQMRAVVGTLASGARAREIVFSGDGLIVLIQDAHFRLVPGSLLSLSPRVVDLGAARVEVRMKPSDQPRSPLPDSIALPFDLSIGNARIGELVIDDGTRAFNLSNVHLEYAGGRRRHHIKELDAVLMDRAVAMRGTIDARRPFRISAHLAAASAAPPMIDASASVTGDLSELNVVARARGLDASADATVTLRPEDPQPVVAFKALAKNIDPHAISPNLPHAEIEADIALSRVRDRLQGPVMVRNRIPGPIDQQQVPLASLQAELIADLVAFTFSSLRADLGAAGIITGTGDFEDREATLELSTRELNLHAVHSKLRTTQLAGGASVRLSGSSQNVTGRIAQDDIELSISAHRTGDDVQVAHARVEARGGRTEAQGHINLGGALPFTVQARLSRFDPSAWGEFPRGQINASLDANGVVQPLAVRVLFAIRDSRWMGAPLAGNGTVEATQQRVAQADVHLQLGANRVNVKGAFGAPRDSLAVSFDAPNLASIHGSLRGRSRGRAEVAGTFDAPQIQLDAEGAGLSFGSYGSLGTLQIRGRASFSGDMPIEVRASLGGINAPQVSLRSATLNVQGSRLRHEASLDAVGKPIDLRLRIRGGMSAENVWTGSVLEFVNRGELPLQLTRPVDLKIARALLQAQPFELRAVGGRMIVDALDYDNERLRTAGSFQALPIAQLIELFNKQAPVKGSLRLSGRWQLRTDPQLRGSVNIARDSGDLFINRIKPFDLGLSGLTAAADITPARIQFRASLDAALAQFRVSGRVAGIGGEGSIPYAATSPVDFTATVNVARLAPFADFIDTAMIVQGEAQARLQGNGTLGEPQITGQVNARNLSLSMPADGVNLTNGVLAAVITPQQIRVESFSIRGGAGLLTARGALARTGFDNASVDWKADRFTALGRPDRKVVVSGTGSAVMKDKRLSIAGNVRVDEGNVELGESGLPVLSSDVVIVGREHPKPVRGERNFGNVALDLALNLGNRMRVSGSGLSVWLSGALKLQTTPAGQLRATGTVQTRDGTFVAYGQRLVIDRGNIYFNGPLTNPGLDIVAMRKRQAVEAGVALTGTLQTPLVRVVSDPPVPQGEALSWLVLGRSPNEAGSGELSALPLASNLLIGKATSPLKDALKLDELGIRGNAAGHQLLTLGKRLTDNLYLLFEGGVDATGNLLRLEYNLTRRVVLRLQAGGSSGGGMFYRRRWD